MKTMNRKACSGGFLEQLAKGSEVYLGKNNWKEKTLS